MSLKPFNLALEKSRPQKVFMAAMVVQKAQEVVGDQARVISFKNGVLRICVASSVAAAVLKSGDAELIVKINNKIDSQLIKKLTFKVGS